MNDGLGKMEMEATGLGIMQREDLITFWTE